MIWARRHLARESGQVEYVQVVIGAPRAVAASLLASAASAMAMRPGLAMVLVKGCAGAGSAMLRPGLAPRAPSSPPWGLSRSRLPGDCSSEFGDVPCTQTR